MKVAILHSWFLVDGGAERVVETLAGIYPEADVYALFVNRRNYLRFCGAVECIPAFSMLFRSRPKCIANFSPFIHGPSKAST